MNTVYECNPVNSRSQSLSQTVVFFCQDRDIRHFCNAFFVSFCTCKNDQKHVSTGPLFGPTSVLERFIIPPSPYCFLLLLLLVFKGSERDMPMTPPPQFMASLTAKSLQWPNLLLSVVGNIMVERSWIFSFGSCCCGAAERAVIWLSS